MHALLRTIVSKPRHGMPRDYACRPPRGGGMCSLCICMHICPHAYVIYRRSIEDLSKIYRRSIDNPPNMHRMSEIENLRSSIHPTSKNRPKPRSLEVPRRESRSEVHFLPSHLLAPRVLIGNCQNYGGGHSQYNAL
jgi:hypothetical protein